MLAAPGEPEARNILRGLVLLRDADGIASRVSETIAPGILVSRTGGHEYRAAGNGYSIHRN
jgi:hypothetical protein